MKTKWLATALIAVCAWGGAAHASDSLVLQDTATIYGLVDGGLGYINYRYYDPNEEEGYRLGTAGRAWQLQSAGNLSNLFGFKASMPLFEDLLGVFKFEGTFNNLNLRYDGGLFGVNAYAGVVSPTWGSLLTGWQKSVSDDFFEGPFANFAFKQMPADNVAGLHGDVFGNASGWPGAGIKYLSPSYQGVRYGASLAYGLKFKTDDNTESATLKPQGNFVHAALAVGYEQGPWKAAATYDFYQHLGITRSRDDAALWEQAYTLSLNYTQDWGRSYLAFGQAFAPNAYAFGQYAHVGANLAGNATENLRSTSPQFGNPRYPGSHIAFSKHYSNTAAALGTVLNVGHQQLFLGYSLGYSKADIHFLLQTTVAKNQQNGGNGSGGAGSGVTDSTKKNTHIDGTTGSAGAGGGGGGNGGVGGSMYHPGLPHVSLFDAATDPLTEEEKKDPTRFQPQAFRAITQLFQVGYVFNLSDSTSLYLYGGYGWIQYQKKYTPGQACDGRALLCTYLDQYNQTHTDSSWKTTTRVTLKQVGLGITQSF